MHSKPSGVRCSVFCAVSLDGFIARKDGALDWLKPAESTLPPADTGYDAFMTSVDSVVMGRNTFDVVLGMGDSWFYPRPVFVLTTRPLPLPERLKDKVEFGRHSPAEIVDLMERRGAKRLYVDGGKTIQDFLKAGLINDLVITQIPVLIGEGIPLFGPLGKDVRLTIESSRVLGGGAVQTTYIVETRPPQTA
ncbi:MAG TPA: dihydrofolate reductase family protein [Planctomycetota bacterium]|jgi:dihydrofolate reductase|nr:dihydrofolate reductase family protein [Planctomycetota bacterium]